MLLLLLLDGMEVGVNSREGEELRRRRRRSSIESREWKRERERERERERQRDRETIPSLVACPTFVPQV
jgi:hypothetical protein